MKKIFKIVFDGVGTRVFEDGVDIGDPHVTYGSGTNVALSESLHPEFKGKLQPGVPHFLIGGRHFLLMNWPDGCLPVKTDSGWVETFVVEDAP